jgi:RNA polymerase sigma factor (sigma-70 family)
MWDAPPRSEWNKAQPRARALDDAWAEPGDRWSREPDGVPELEDVTDAPGFSAHTAQQLALFAYNVARKFFPYRADLVEEAVQETLTRTCERWEYVTERDAPEAWVVNTATYVCQEKLREERRGARCFGERPVQSQRDEEFARRELLAQSLRRLTRRQRLVIVWRYLFDFSVRETATALGLTESKVRDASHNGIGRLRKLLGEEWSDWA